MSRRRADVCPICGRPARGESDVAPFCSDRCKMVDLGRWLRGEYVVAGEAAVAFDPDLADAHPPWDEGEEGGSADG